MLVKRWMQVFAVVNLFLVGFVLYGSWPREDRYAHIVSQLYARDLLLETNALYSVECKLGSTQLTAMFHSRDYDGTLQECAATAIVQAAKRDNIQLPSGFENEISVKKIDTVAFSEPAETHIDL